jgi:hypothetical protein
MPSKGRLLIFKVNAQECKFDLIHEKQAPGSIQALATMKENHKYLILGINNRIIVYSLNLRYGDHFEIEAHDSKVSGTFTQCIKTIDFQIVVGDIMKGIIVFDLKEGRQGKISLVEGPSSCQMNIWVNEILILSKTKYMVLDKEKNIFIFQRNLKPANEI